MDQSLQEKIKQCPALPSLPTIAVQVLELAQREEVDLGEIARIITQDPALSGRILKTVNSSFYGRAHAVGTVSHAMVILGLQSVKTLVLGFSLVNNLTQDRKKGFNHLAYWRHSIVAATSSRLLATKLGVVQTEEAFLGALLADIGVLILERVFGESYAELYKSIRSHSELADRELQMLGTTHAEVGGMIAESWKLPPVLQQPILLHHTTELSVEPQLAKLIQVVGLSGRCADVFCDQDPSNAISDVRAYLKANHNIPVDEADQILAEVSSKTREVASLFEINIGSSIDYTDVLKKANEALVELTLRSQQQQQTLEIQNHKLKVDATTDRLTGLNNRATFDEFMTKVFSEAVKTKKPLSLVMIDLDKFKSVNDTHGHPAGDAVLRYVGTMLKDFVRPDDMTARYGGEEMVMVFPDTPKNLATALAETLRRAIAANRINIGDGKAILVTASLGVATLEPNSPLKQPAHLIKAADMALYKAKHSGRNNVKVFSLPAPKQKAA